MPPGGIRNRNPIKPKTKTHALDWAATGIYTSLVYLNNLRMWMVWEKQETYIEIR